uniref:ELM2 domain-containing protein n=1 Tax=Panagrolaimus davidi TaxID=227884 RepID=A0A914PXD9_9BILA
MIKDSRGNRVSQNSGPRAKQSPTARSIRNTTLKGHEQKFDDDIDPLFDHSSFNHVTIDNKIKIDKLMKRKRCVTLDDYVKCAAKIPSLQDDSDRDERISASENYKLLTDSQMERYVKTCEAKFHGDTHTAFAHLSANGYSIKKALETTDNPDSSPMKYLNENLGIWTEDELKNFARLILDNRILLSPIFVCYLSHD